MQRLLFPAYKMGLIISIPKISQKILGAVLPYRQLTINIGCYYSREMWESTFLSKASVQSFPATPLSLSGSRKLSLIYSLLNGLVSAGSSPRGQTQHGTVLVSCA